MVGGDSVMKGMDLVTVLAVLDWVAEDLVTVVAVLG